MNVRLKLKKGDCLEVLRTAPDNYVDSLVTDPPAGISFMGKDWDGDKGGRDEWVKWLTDVMRECLRVLKPGAHGLVWAIPRTSHWTMMALENAGFEIRDVVTHLFGTGFPKSLDVSKAIDKAAGAERQVVGLKERPGGFNRGVLANSNFGRAYQEDSGVITSPSTDAAKQWQGLGTALKPACEFWVLVRKPCSEKTVAANVLKHGVGALNIDASRIGTEQRHNPSASNQDREAWRMNTSETEGRTATGRFPANLVLDETAATNLDEQADNPVSRFFYVAKASKKDRGEGNTHPTVKNTELMKYLIKLVTPPQGTVLDPFMGSGSTGVAALAEGFGFCGVECSDEYFAIAERRIKGGEVT